MNFLKLRVLVVFLVLGIVFAAGALANDPPRATRIHVPSNSYFEGLHHNVAYSPDNGFFYIRRTEGAGSPGTPGTSRMRPIRSLGSIPGLDPNVTLFQAEVVAANAVYTVPTGEAPVLAIRHGHWVSIVDPINDQLIWGNIGPSSATHLADEFNRVIRKPNGRGHIVIFVAEATELRDDGRPRGNSERRLYIADTELRRVGWLDIRADESPRRRSVEYSFTDEGALRIRYEFPESLANIVPSGGAGGVRVTMTGNVPTPGEVVINLSTGDTTQLQGSGLVARGMVINERTSKLMSGPYTSQQLAQRLGVPDVTPQRLAQEGSPNDPNARSVAIATASREIDRVAGIESGVRAGMASLVGQERVIDALAAFARHQATDARGHAVLAFGGPTGVGKTSGFRLFVDAYLRARGVATENAVFVMNLNGHTNVELFRAEWLGSTPPYVGSGTPSPFVHWLLMHPDGGGFLIDEIDQSHPDVIETLRQFLDTGEVVLPGALTEALCKSYKDIPVERWPRGLRESTHEGQNKEAPLRLRLTANHFIGLGTNAGSENFGMGERERGRALRSDQDIEAANRRFTADMVRRELERRGFRRELLNRVDAFIPFGMLTRAAHSRIVDQSIAALTADYSTRLVSVELTDSARAFLRTETYNTESGARNIAGDVSGWVSRFIQQELFTSRRVRPGDQIRVDVTPGDGSTVAPRIRIFRVGNARGALATPELVVESDTGRPLPSSPTTLLARARERLVSTLERRILGHREEIRLVADAIIAQLALSVQDPARRGLPLILYVDSTPGVGKTELAKAVAEALFEDPNRMTRIDFNDVPTLDTLHAQAFRDMRAAVRTSPENLVMLWDELPRAGAGTGHARLIQNQLMALLDEGRIPESPGVVDRIQLPASTVIIATGNLAADALGPGRHDMNLRELLAHFRYMTRHPAQFIEIWSQVFHDAFRSRMGGRPILWAPLNEVEVRELRGRFFEQIAEPLRRSGIELVLADSAVEFFEREYRPLEGGRWLRNTLTTYVQSRLLAMVTGQEEQYRGTRMEITWNSESRELRVRVLRGGEQVEEQLVSRFPRSGSDFNPESQARADWMVSSHEGGHAIVRAVLIGPRAVAEMNTFGAPSGGWMEPALDTPGEDIFTRTRSGIYRIAGLLGGHIAELRTIRDEFGQPLTSTGASSDFARARDLARSMIIHGALPALAPVAIFTRPDGSLDASDEARRNLERQVQYVLEYAGYLANRVLETNAGLHMELSRALHESTEMTLSRDQIVRILGDRLVTVQESDFAAANEWALERTRTISSGDCRNLLTVADAIPTTRAPSRWRAFWSRIGRWFGFR